MLWIKRMTSLHARFATCRTNRISASVHAWRTDGTVRTRTPYARRCSVRRVFEVDVKLRTETVLGLGTQPSYAHS
jgi:hypothetical protein